MPNPRETFDVWIGDAQTVRKLCNEARSAPQRRRRDLAIQSRRHPFEHLQMNLHDWHSRLQDLNWLACPVARQLGNGVPLGVDDGQSSMFVRNHSWVLRQVSTVSTLGELAMI
jgi:hypothetical protein